MRGKTSTGQPWMTKDECELFEYVGADIEQICSFKGCKYYKHLRDNKWGYCDKRKIIIKLVQPSQFNKKGEDG